MGHMKYFCPKMYFCAKRASKISENANSLTNRFVNKEEGYNKEMDRTNKIS